MLVAGAHRRSWRIGEHSDRTGKVLCIIESMKLMNEIEADTAGADRKQARSKQPTGGIRRSPLWHPSRLRKYWSQTGEKLRCASSAHARISAFPRLPSIQKRTGTAWPVRFADQAICIGPAKSAAQLSGYSVHHQRRRNYQCGRDPPWLRLPQRKFKLRRSAAVCPAISSSGLRPEVIADGHYKTPHAPSCRKTACRFYPVSEERAVEG